MSALAVQPISNFETNAGSFRRGKNRVPAASDATTSAPPIVKPGASTKAFQDFKQKRQATKGGTKKKVRAEPAKPGTPTRERMAKADTPRRTATGFYRVAHPVERLRDQGKLDPHPQINFAMCAAAEKLYAHFYEGGMRGIAAQDLSSGNFGGGDGGSCQMPKSERAVYHREKFREATRLMGWFIDAPHRGAGRIVVDVVCYEMGVEEAGRVHAPSGRTETIKTIGMDRLREGLFMLATAWRLY